MTVASKITPEDIEANIVAEYVYNMGEATLALGMPSLPTLDLLTIVVLVLKNGIKVTGESACVSPENFNADIGRQVARANAVNKIWPMMGYELATKLQTRAGGQVEEHF